MMRRALRIFVAFGYHGLGTSHPHLKAVIGKITQRCLQELKLSGKRSLMSESGRFLIRNRNNSPEKQSPMLPRRSGLSGSAIRSLSD